MSSHYTSKNNHKTKKQLVLGNPGRRINPVILVITIAMIVSAAGAAYWVWTAPGGSTPSAAMSPTSAPQEGPREVVYPLSLFSDGKARHFEYPSNGSTIRYFILKSSDGVVRAAFDACDVCWPAGKGYTQMGDEMACNNCGRRFASILINEVQGGCNPAPLKRTIQGDQLVIYGNDIVEGKIYFNFKEKV